MNLIKLLDQLSPTDAPRVGGKAYNCARLKQSGFPVPDGFAVTTDAMGESLPENELNEALARFPTGTRFAVRSSAADEDSAGHSFAGIHGTKLNVTSNGIPDATRACWSSVQSPQAKAYRRTQGLSTDSVQTGVLVQAMIQPVAAGVAFTQNPVTDESDELIITASWGLGEAVVSGHVEPDEFHVRKSDGAVLSAHVGSKSHRVVSEDGVSRLVETEKHERTRPALTDKQLRELTNLLIRIEQHYDAPQDVEWCHDGAQFWIVQSRPVTTRPLATHADIVWTRANVREILPDLTSPQTLSGICGIIDQAARIYYTDLLAPAEELGPLVKAFYGRPYFNLSQFRQTCRLTGYPPAQMLRALGHEGEVRPDDELASRPSLHEFFRALPAMLRILRAQLAVRKVMRKQFALVEEYVNRLTSRDPRALSDVEIRSVIRTTTDAMPEALWTAFMLVGGLVLYEGMVRTICERVGFPPDRLLHTQLPIGEKSVSAQQGFDLLALANQARREERARDYFRSASSLFNDYRESLRGTDFLMQFDTFMQRYGHRGNYESDLALPRYREDPTLLLCAIRTHVHAPDCPTPEDIYARQEREAAETWHAFEAKFNWWQRLTLIPRVRWALKWTKQMCLWRELNRSEMIRGGSEFRRWHLVLAERFAERGWVDTCDDYFFLECDEISMVIVDVNEAEALKSLVARRKADYDSWRHLEMPLLMRESELPTLIRRTTSAMPDTSVAQLRGLCISAGWAEGEVVVIHEPTEFARMKPGAILVAPATDPAWTPLFTLASGIIVEIGGTTSHASIIAREYGLSALANVKNATKLLKNGDRVRLDATNATVDILSTPQKF